MKRPYRQGQTLWIVWTQVNAKGQTEAVVKPVMIVSCRLDHPDPDYLTTGWETIVEFYAKFERDIESMPTVTSLMGMLTYKTYRKAKRVADLWTKLRSIHEAEIKQRYGTIQEIY